MSPSTENPQGLLNTLALTFKKSRLKKSS